YAQACPGVAQVAEYHHYYPFGMELQALCYTSGADLQNNNLYNGKELQTDYGLQWYDYGARFYDPEIGRWHVIDPMANQFYFNSPYVYCKNNPLILFDPDGLYPKSILKYDPNIGLYGGYHFTQSAATLLSLVSGVDNYYIQNATILERAPGHYLPWYTSNGGGAMTLGPSSDQAYIIFTQNYFADDPK